jgi:hypothetical protein
MGRRIRRTKRTLRRMMIMEIAKRKRGRAIWMEMETILIRIVMRVVMMSKMRIMMIST